jgi:hypothetical protein
MSESITAAATAITALRSVPDAAAPTARHLAPSDSLSTSALAFPGAANTAQAIATSATLLIIETIR